VCHFRPHAFGQQSGEATIAAPLNRFFRS
jgi:hypothetical protein